MGPYCALKAFSATHPPYALGLCLALLLVMPVAGDEQGADTATPPASPPVAAPPPVAAAPSSETTEPAAAETTEPSAPKPQLTVPFEPHIRQILEAHCVECHGPKHAKGEMRIDDRASFLSYIAPGDLESSALWGDYLMSQDPEMRMPPPAHGNPLSPLELAALRVWIEEGADWPESTPIAAEVTAPAPVQAPTKNPFQKALTFLGFFHPAVVHFPIGLLLVSSLFIMLAFIKRETFEPAAFHCLWIGAAGAVAASVAGWAFADIRGYGDFWHTHWSTDPIARHRICGIIVAASAVGLSMLAFVARRRTSSDLRLVWLGGAICLALLVSLVGHQGGELTYGEELFSRAFEQAFGE